MVFGADGLWRSRDGKTVDPSGTPPVDPGTPLFAGHIPYRVIVGMNAADDGSGVIPEYQLAGQVMGGGIYYGQARRMFSSATPTLTKLTSMVNACESRGQLPVVSFKVGGDWQGTAEGSHDDWLTMIRTYGINKRVANGGNGLPFLIGLHHEPNGDWPSGMTAEEGLAWWGRMHVRLLNVVTGWASRGYGNTGGTYNASQDVRDIISVSPIANGFWWGTKFSYPSRVAAAYSPELIAAFNDRGGPLMADMYDPTLDNVSVTYTSDGDRVEASFGYPSNYDRCWREIQTMVAWARANGVKSIGFGEMGNTNQANWDATTDQLMANRDVISVALFFNNWQASKWDWRAWPANGGDLYGLNATYVRDGVTMVDRGGDPLSAAYISKFKTMIDRSLAETSPF